MGLFYNLQFTVQTIPDPHDPSKKLSRISTGPAALFNAGIVLNITVGVDSITEGELLKEEKQPVAPITVKALVDTGCTITSIDRGLAEKLSLRTIGLSSTYTANGLAQVSAHLVSFSFPGTHLRSHTLHKVHSANLTGQPFQVLIGRDIMAQWIINYNGPAGFISIAD